MVVTIPSEGFEEPTLFETIISVLQYPETWFLALGFAVVSSATAAGLFRFRLIESRALTVVVATVAPLLCFQIALLVFGAGEVPQSLFALVLSDMWIAFELGFGLIVGFVASNLVVRLMHGHRYEESAETLK